MHMPDCKPEDQWGNLLRNADDSARRFTEQHFCYNPVISLITICPFLEISSNLKPHTSPNCSNSLCSGGSPLLPMIIHSRTLTWCSSTSMFPFLGEYHLDQQIVLQPFAKSVHSKINHSSHILPLSCPFHCSVSVYVTPSIIPKVHSGHLLVWGDVQWVWHICYCGGNNAGVLWLLIQILFTSYVHHATTTATQRCAQAGFWSIFSSELGVSARYKFNVV